MSFFSLESSLQQLSQTFMSNRSYSTLKSVFPDPNSQAKLQEQSASVTVAVSTACDPPKLDDFNPVASASASDAKEAGDVVRTFTKFDDMQLKDDILRGVYAFGFETPSVIQQKGIVPVSQGGDVILQAQSGTGKTAAFGIGVLQQLRTDVPDCQALILSPTRELALQTQSVVAALGERMNVRTHCAVGGTVVAEDVSMLRSGVHVLCGTPGRIWDHIQRGNLNTTTISTKVLDEVDEMLSAGFHDQVRNVFKAMPTNCQAVAVSATLTEQVLETINRFMRNPTKILIPPEEVPLKAIQQYFVDCGKPSSRFDVLCDIYEHLSVNQTVIFCNTRGAAEELARQLQEADFSVSVLHSELPPQERMVRMRDFRRGSTRVLIATDIIARGIDVQQVSIVVNFDVPRDPANYIHRIGRGGRHGRKGSAINLVTARDAQALQDIESYYSIQIKELPVNFPELLA
jgi:superfamily II DNA/RNA helicase